MRKVNKKTFCILPWIHLSTRANGHMRVCCTANASSARVTNDEIFRRQVGIIKNADGRPANLNRTGLFQAWNNGYMRGVRLDMLAGRIPPSCTKCFKEEESGHRSKRQWETACWSKNLDVERLIAETAEDGSVSPKLYYIDLRFGTKCNLKCVMCSPHDSSLWVKDWNKLYPQIKNKSLKENMRWDNKGRVNGASYHWYRNNRTFWAQLYEQIPHLKQLYLAGGEPTIIKEHYALLEKCIEMGYASNIQLRYNSNGVELPQKLFDLWRNFASVRFHYSIDSIGAMNDYIRYPSKWDGMLKGFELLDRTEKNVEVTIACAVQMLNMYYIPDLIKWKIRRNFKKISAWPQGAALVNCHFVYLPPYLNVRVFPKWFKRKIEKKYEDLYVWLEKNFASTGGDQWSYDDFMRAEYGIKRLKGMIRFMNSEDWSARMPEFREYISRLDRIRGTKFQKIFPEMKALLKA